MSLSTEAFDFDFNFQSLSCTNYQTVFDGCDIDWLFEPLIKVIDTLVRIHTLIHLVNCLLKNNILLKSFKGTTMFKEANDQHGRVRKYILDILVRWSNKSLTVPIHYWFHWYHHQYLRQLIIVQRLTRNKNQRTTAQCTIFYAHFAWALSVWGYTTFRQYRMHVAWQHFVKIGALELGAGTEFDALDKQFNQLPNATYM